MGGDWRYDGSELTENYMQPLYFSPAQISFEKTASEVTLPENANLWPNEIMQELYKQVPYIADFEPNVVMDRVDAERGYGFGHVEVQNKTELQQGASEQALQAVGVQTVRIPVIIKNRKLLPFDVLITKDSKALPLTEGRMRQALFRPQAFDVTSRTPGDQSMVGQLYPPFRQNYGFGGGGVGMSVGMGKEGSSLEDFLSKEAVSEKWVRDRLSSALHPVARSADAVEDFADRAYHARDAVSGRLGAAIDKWRKAADHELLDKEVASLGKQLRNRNAAYNAADVELSRRGKQAAANQKCSKCGSMEKCSCWGKMASAIPNSTMAEPKGPTVKHVVPKVKHGSVLKAILPTINVEDYTKFAEALQEPGLQALYMQNRAATGESITTLSQFDPVSLDKTAQAIESRVRPNVVQVTKLAQGYAVKTAHTEFWQPSIRMMDRGQAVQAFGSKVVLAADMSGSVTVTDGEGAKSSGPEGKPELVSSFGLYRVKDEEGQELVGYVFPNLLDVDGTALPVALFTNGSVTAMQEAVAGEAVGKDSGLVFGPMKGHGMFVRQLPNGSVDAMVPMTIQGGYSEGGDKKLHVETFDGREMFVAVQPNIQRPTEVDGTCLVPADFRWMPLGGDSVSLVEHPEAWGQAKEASRAFASVTIRAGHENSFSVSGIPVEKLASSERDFLSLDDTMFLLAGLGVDLTHAGEKVAESLAYSAPVQVRVGRYLKTASGQKASSAKLASAFLSSVPNLRVSLIKEAAFVPDPMAVDTVLSVGFINPENIMTFVSYLPQLDASQERMCELLVASRLGLSDVPTSPLEKSIKSLEDVIDGLKVLAFQKS